jgi:hypothetical protein
MAKAKRTTAVDQVGATSQAQEAVSGMPKSFRAFTTMKTPAGWVFLELTLDSDMNVTNVQASTPDMRDIVKEKFKIAVGRYWQKQAE